MLLDSAPLSQIYARFLPGTVRVLPENLALHHFRNSHPAEYASTCNQLVSSVCEDNNILHLPVAFIDHASKTTLGAAHHYFNGLAFANRQVKQVVEHILTASSAGFFDCDKALNMIAKHLEAICKARYNTLYNNVYKPELAFDFAVLEMATYLFIHTHAEQGKMWINRLYHL